MLNLYIGGITEQPLIPVVRNVHKEFDMLGLSGSSDEELFLNRLEKGKSIPGDSYAFIDRFGFKLAASNMSAGCKAAVCVLRNPDKLIDLTECGFNAVGMILAWCKKGNIYLPKYMITFPDYSHEEVKICLGDYVFSTISRLNHYLDSEWPFEPDMSRGGITFS